MSAALVATFARSPAGSPPPRHAPPSGGRSRTASGAERGRPPPHRRRARGLAGAPGAARQGGRSALDLDRAGSCPGPRGRLAPRDPDRVRQAAGQVGRHGPGARRGRLGAVRDPRDVRPARRRGSPPARHRSRRGAPRGDRADGRLEAAALSGIVRTVVQQRGGVDGVHQPDRARPRGRDLRDPARRGRGPAGPAPPWRPGHRCGAARRASSRSSTA